MPCGDWLRQCINIELLCSREIPRGAPRWEFLFRFVFNKQLCQAASDIDQWFAPGKLLSRRVYSLITLKYWTFSSGRRFMLFCRWTIPSGTSSQVSNNLSCIVCLYCMTSPVDDTIMRERLRMVSAGTREFLPLR